MRCLTLATSYPKFAEDGTAPFIRSISHGLSQHGAEIQLLLPAHPDVHWPNGDPPLSLRFFEYAPVRSRYLHAWGYAGGLRADRQLRARAIALLPGAATSCLIALNSLTHSCAPDLLHSHWVLPNGPLAAIAARYHNLPLVISLHGSGIAVAERNPALKAAARFAFSVARRVTACSADLAERAVDLGADPLRISVIPYGVDVDEIRPNGEVERIRLLRRLRIEPDACVGLALGRLVAKKGFDQLIAAMPAIQSRFNLVIAGDGDLRGALEEQAKKVGVSHRIRFLGSVDRTRVRSLLQASDLLIVPSVRDDTGNVDGLPNVLIEGMAAGLPIVASRIAGIPSVIKDGTTGILVTPGEPAALSTAIHTLMDDERLRVRLGTAARRKAESGLSWQTITGRYFDVLRAATLDAQAQV